MPEVVEKVLWRSGCCHSLRSTCPSSLSFRLSKISVKGFSFRCFRVRSFYRPIHYFVGAFVDILIGIPPLCVGNMKPKNFLSVEKYSIIDWRIPLAYNRIVG